MTYYADAWARPSVTTLYVARPLELPPLTAQAAFDGRVERTSPAQAGLPWLVETASARLRLLAGAYHDPPGVMWPLRRVPARLHDTRGKSGIPVEVEVASWSAARCEIGIRPRDRTVPMTDGRRQRRYFALAVEAAEGLAHVLERAVEDGMAAQLCGPQTEWVSPAA